MTPAIWPNCRSSGAATVAAIVSGLAPASCADTWMVGKSTCGSGATGSNGKATMPTSASAAISSEVAIGRRMKGSEMFMTPRATLFGACCGLGVDARCRPAGDTGR